MLRAAGTFILVVLLGWYATQGAPLALFWDLPSLGLVLGGTFAVLLMAGNTHVWENVLCFLSFQAGKLSEADRAGLQAFFLTGSRAALGLGIAGGLCSLTMCLQSFSSPDSVGPALAVALLPVLYGVLLSEFVFVPMAAPLACASPSGSAPPKPGIGLLIVAGLVGTAAAGLWAASAALD